MLTDPILSVLTSNCHSSYLIISYMLIDPIHAASSCFPLPLFISRGLGLSIESRSPAFLWDNLSSGGLGLPTQSGFISFPVSQLKFRQFRPSYWIKFHQPSCEFIKSSPKLLPSVTMHRSVSRPSYESSLVRPSLEYINYYISFYSKVIRHGLR